MNREIAIRRAIAIEADSPEFYNKARDLGGVAARLFGVAKRAQITGLQAIANSTLKVSDVLDYVKKQVGRDSRNWCRENFGKSLIETLDVSLRERLDVLELSDPLRDAAGRQRAHLALIREFVRQLAAQYEYMRAQEQETRA